MSKIRNTRDELGVFLAIENGSIGTLDALLAKGVDFTKSWHCGNTVLHWTSMKASSRVLEWLLKRKIADESSIINDCGATALHLAAGYATDPLKKIELLGDLKLDPNRPDFEKKAALHYALQSSAVSTKVVTKPKANFKAKDKTNSNVLDYAIQNRKASSKLIEDLLSLDVDINQIDNKKKTPLAYLVEDRSTTRTKKLVPVLLPGKPGIKPSKGEDSVLHLAAKNPAFSQQTFRQLLSHEGCEGCVDDEDRNPLHFVPLCYKDPTQTTESRKRLKGILDILLKQKGIDINAADKNGATVLHYLASIPTQPANVMQLFLSKINNPNATDHNKETALHILLRENSYADKPN